MARRVYEDPKLEMTPMIDVVFQLLIFFIVTLKQEDILSHLDISRPAPEKEITQPENEIKDLVRVIVDNRGFVVQGRRVDVRTLDRYLTRLGEISTTTSVIIECTADSPHRFLVQLLDLCAKARLTNLSVFSL